MNLTSLSRDWFLLRRFRNGGELYRYLRGGPIPDHAELRFSGHTVRHPARRAGLVEALVEIWHDKVYRPPGFFERRPGDVVVDIGSNVGLFVLDFLRWHPGASAHCFEPFPETYAALRENLKMLEGRAVGHAVACGRSRSSSNMAAGDRALDAKLAGPGSPEAVSGVQVDVWPLSDVLDAAGPRVDYLKMDIEGGESDAFASAPAERVAAIRNIAIEYHDNIRPGTRDEILGRLSLTHACELVPSSVAGVGMLYARRKAS